MARMIAVSGRDTAVAAYGALMILIVLSPIVEYGPSVWQRFLDLDFARYQISDAEFAAAGWLRYLRDGLVLAGVLAGPVAAGIPRRGYFMFLAWEMSLIAIGTVGHIALPRPDLYVCGLRWLLNLHLAATIALVLRDCSEATWRRFRKWFGRALFVVMAMLLGGSAYQWATLGFPTGIRLTSFLPQAEMVVELAQGLAFFVIATTASIGAETAATTQLLAAGVLTATRMATVYAAVLIGRRFLVGPNSRMQPARLILGMLAFLAVLAGSIPVASFLAQRGPVLAQQFDSARLSDWPAEIDLADRQDLMTLFFGKGLGYRTTTAGTLHLDEKYGDPYIRGHENAVAALFAQVGATGLVVVAFGIAILLRSLMAAAGGDAVARARIVALAAVIAVLSMAGYWYEWPLFVLPVAAGLGGMLRLAS